MKPYLGAASGAVLLMLAAAQPATAAWNNVFQVCCFGCKERVAASPYVAAAPPVAVAAAPAAAAQDCAPQQQCTTRYHQRSYYEPVTSYRQSCYYEPVTSYRTSYYYEPCTSYRYSCYYDPCTCSYRQVATPVTSYRLRSQSCPVTSYLQRCCMQPVTSYRLRTYYVPETTCCQTTIGSPVFTPPNGNGAVAVPSVGEQSTPPPAAPPSVGEESTIPPAVSDSMKYNRTMPKVFEGSSGKLQPRAPTPTPPPPAAPPRVRLDRIVSLSGSNVQGQLLSSSQSAEADTQLMFVSEDRQRTREVVTTDASGQFQVRLAEGSWLIYVPGQDGRPAYRQKIQVRDSVRPQTILVSR